MFDWVVRAHHVSKKHLSLADVPSIYCIDELERVDRFFKPKQCFDNAYIHSQLYNSTYVLGYVYLPSFGIVIEHAWNVTERGHADYTRALYWDNSASDEVYIEMLRLSPDEAITLMEELGGVDHMTLRYSDEYRHLFRID